MSTRIKLLSELTRSQIAAGEVIERPASVVKELIENSLDSEASEIAVHITQGGLHKIEVRDDGHGIFYEDLPLVLQQHTTSKIGELSDLDTLVSFGFRGEALASMHAVARVEVLTATENSLAYSLAQGQINLSSRSKGTTIIVKDLFNKVPVRRKFLKSARTEFIHIQNIFTRLALTNFKVAFSLWHNEKLIKRLVPAMNFNQQAYRLEKIFTKVIMQKLKHISFVQNELHIHGWIGSANDDVAFDTCQYTFLNSRAVRDKVLMHAIRSAFLEINPDMRAGAYCLYIDMPSNYFDVNVHPSKTEVRFCEPRIIHTALVEAIRLALNEPKSINNKLNNTSEAIGSYKNKVLKESSFSQQILLGELFLQKINNQVQVVKLVEAIRHLLRVLILQQQFVSVSLQEPIIVNNHANINKTTLAKLADLGLLVDEGFNAELIIRSMPRFFDFEFNFNFNYFFDNLTEDFSLNLTALVECFVLEKSNVDLPELFDILENYIPLAKYSKILNLDKFTTMIF